MDRSEKERVPWRRAGRKRERERKMMSGSVKRWSASQTLMAHPPWQISSAESVRGQDVHDVS